MTINTTTMATKGLLKSFEKGAEVKAIRKESKEFAKIAKYQADMTVDNSTLETVYCLVATAFFCLTVIFLPLAIKKAAEYFRQKKVQASSHAFGTVEEVKRFNKEILKPAIDNLSKALPKAEKKAKKKAEKEAAAVMVNKGWFGFLRA
jgi:hypothetical protein